MEVIVDVSGVTLETERLILRSWRETDLADLYEYASVAGVGEMAGWPHHKSIEESQKILAFFIAQKNGFALELKENKKVIGSLSLIKSCADNKNEFAHLKIMEVGYALSKKYWGKGLMPEAVLAAAKFAFEELKLDALTCSHFTFNNQSRRVIEKTGFKFVKQSTWYAEQMQQTFETMNYILLKPLFK